MKFTAIILLSAFLTASARGDAQVTLRERDASLPAVFSAIKKQTGYDFVYRMELVRQAGKISVNLRNVTLEQALDQCLKGTALTYVIIENTVVIRARENSGEPEEETKTLAPPPIDISGKVTDADGNPLIGASVTVKGKQIGTTTDAGGVFVLKGLSAEDEIIITYTGFQTKSYKVGTRTSFLVSLELDARNLQEVVINKGYYTEKQKFSTGNVGRVTAKEIEKQPINNLVLALQGRIPGVHIEQVSGAPGSGINIRIQGILSLSQNVQPLYVIDGVPFPTQFLFSNSPIQGRNQGGTHGNPLAYINPSDIESIDVLKDADATAIYGSLAAAGAIIITTKRGTAGNTQIDINVKQGWSEVGRTLKLLNTQQYIEMREEAISNDGGVIGPVDYDLNGVWDKNRHTNWQKELMGGKAKYTDCQISVSGGNTNTRILVGAGYHQETGVFPGGIADQQGSLHANLFHTSNNKRFNVQLNTKYIFNWNNLINTDLTQIAVTMPPNAPALYTDDGLLNWAPDDNGNSTWLNPLAFLNSSSNIRVNNLLSSLNLEYEVLPALKAKILLGFNKLDRSEILLQPLSIAAPEWRPYYQLTSQFGDQYFSTVNIEPQMSYVGKVFRQGSVNVLVGATYLNRVSEGKQILAQGFSSESLMKSINAASNLFPQFSSFANYRYSAVFARINYVHNDKYIVNLTARKDGSSRFGSENQTNSFASIGGAWIFSNEVFLKRKFSLLSFGKLKVSYGTSGNDQIGDYRFMTLYSNVIRTVPYQGIVGLNPSGFSNPYLQWEETTKLQFGIDLGFLSDRISVGVNFFKNLSSNQLQSFNLPPFTGNGDITTNFPATLSNYGLESSISLRFFSNDNFQWEGGINLTFLNNKLVKYEGLDNSSYANYYIIGKPFTIARLYRSAGVDPSTGLYQFYNAGGDLTSNPVYPDDISEIINSQPKYFGGIQNRFGVYDFSIDFLIQFNKQQGVNYGLGQNPGQFYSYSTFATFGNQLVNVLDRWQKVGDQATVQKFSANNTGAINNALYAMRSSSLNYTDASYMRLKTVAISWTPKKILKSNLFKNARFFAQAQNLLTFTKYSVDPETRSMNTLPPLRTIAFGVQLIL